MTEEEKVYTSMYSRNAELYHHGIQGQKWGVQNGPPYPLSEEEHKKVIKKKKKDMKETAKKIRSNLNKNYFTLGIGEKSYNREKENQNLIRKYYEQKVDYISEKDCEKGKAFISKYLEKPYSVSVSTFGATMKYIPKYNSASPTYMYYFSY